MKLLRFFFAVIATAVLTSCVPPVGPVPPPEVTFRGAYSPNSVLVRYKPDASPALRAQARAGADGQVKQKYQLVPDLEKLEVPDVKAAVVYLNRLPYVLYAEPDYLYTAVDTIPNDPQFSALWAMSNIRAPAAWDLVSGTSGVVVAVIDTGLDLTHEDLAGNLWTNPDETPDNNIDDDGNGYVDDVHGWDFYANDNDPMDETGHGTHVSGTIGATGNNGMGIAGVNWSVQVMPLRFMGPAGGFSSSAIEALSYAIAKGVPISNNSWGGEGYSVALYEAIRNAGLAGHLFVAAAGNNGWDNDVNRFYPSSYDLENILAVAASTSEDSLASFSNYGATTVDLAAPGVSILSSMPHNSYASLSGTSMSTPHVVGVASLILGRHPDWRHRQLKEQLLATARSAPALAGRVRSGGILDAFAALSHEGATPTPPPAPTSTPEPTPRSTIEPTPTSPPVATPTPASPFVSLASGEFAIAGKVRGRYSDTFVRDGVAESITERLTGGKPGARIDRLEHVWEFHVPAGTSRVFRLNAYMTPSVDGDSMVFEYSTDRVTYTPMVVVTASFPSAFYQSYQFPAGVRDGNLFVRVRDTNRTPGGGNAEDTIFVDHMEIETSLE